MLNLKYAFSRIMAHTQLIQMLIEYRFTIIKK